MKNFFARRSVKTAIIAVVGFICGLVVDSAIFAINPIVAALLKPHFCPQFIIRFH